MEREKFLSSVYIILKNENKILLQKRKGTNLYCNMHALPAGHIDEGENAYEAVIREAKEELGVNLEIKDIKDSFVVQRRNSITDPYYDVYFEFSKYTGIPKIMEEDKCSELIWCDINELPKDMIQFEIDALKMQEEGIKFKVVDEKG